MVPLRLNEGVLYAPVLPIAAPRPRGQGGEVFDQSADQAVNAWTGHPSTGGQGGRLSSFTSPSIHSSNPENGLLLAGHGILTTLRSISRSGRQVRFAHQNTISSRILGPLRGGTENTDSEHLKRKVRAPFLCEARIRKRNWQRIMNCSNSHAASRSDRYIGIAPHSGRARTICSIPKADRPVAILGDALLLKQSPKTP